MHKLTLKLDSLQVQSFETEAAGVLRLGTVHGWQGKGNRACVARRPVIFMCWCPSMVGTVSVVPMTSSGNDTGTTSVRSSPAGSSSVSTRPSGASTSSRTWKR